MVVASLGKVWPTVARGGTVLLVSTFYDAFNSVAQPLSAQVNVAFTSSSGAASTTLIAMVPPGGTLPGGVLNSSATAWAALWDSRNAAPGMVYWSVETPGSPPV